MNEQEIRDFLQGSREEHQVIKKVNFPQLKPAEDPRRMKIGIGYLDDIPVSISAELGSTSIKVRDLLGLEKGSVLELDRPAGETVDIYINQQRFARGEVVILGNNFGLRVHSIYEPDSPAGEKSYG